MDNFRKWLHQERRNCSVSVSELASSIGVSKMQVVSWQKIGSAFVPDTKELSNICSTFAEQYRSCFRLSPDETFIIGNVLFRESVQKIILDNTLRSIRHEGI